ncbi:MAG: glycosyltransferase [Oscillatoriales cyanobacterium]|nr:MAG: glycosyltransferase [Oscillatoriales cyanobacterium]TAF48015.1 MAG: glycosyltransferase [Oscillatoriales cyanobacterium]TAF63965.1 MAG: glycosyltransferase [Oscillatoriales cyanobacterium]
MKVIVALEYRFERTPDSKVWTQTTFPYSFWKRYLDVFDQVCVVARVRDVPDIPSDWQRVDGEGVSFAAIPYYIGPWQYLLKAWQVRHSARNVVKPNDAVILRVGSTIASHIQPMLRQIGHPYAVEVVADPYDVFAPGSIKSPLRPFLRWYSPRQLRHQCLEAATAAYVTQDALQKHYPCPNFSIGVSDVELGEKTFVSQPRYYQEKTAPFTLIFVGTMAQLYKAPDVLINAVAVCVRDGLDIQLILIGNGQYRGELEAQAQALGIGKKVIFLGQLQAGEVVRAQLDQADIFVLPSHQEGLPRAMVEAMARALPCIGSTVGGIPELLAAEDMVSPGDVAALAAKICEVIANPERMAQMSARNLEKAKEYQDELLREQRIEFYRYVRKQTEAWINQKQ